MSIRRKKWGLGLALVTIGMLLLSACVSKPTNPNVEFRIAFNAQPPLLDPLMSTATATQDIARNIFEPLVTLDANGEVKPLIAKSWTQSEDGLTTTFELRQGLTFHNGETLKAEDVVASLERWISTSSMGKQFFEGAHVSKKDDTHVDFTTEKPMKAVLDLLADPGQITAIMPKEIIDNTPNEGLTKFIGTGPFEFVEWRTDQYIMLKKFDEYKSPPGEQSGLAGHREVHVQNLRIDFVSDPSTRLAGLQTGEYQAALLIPFDNAALIERDRTLKTIIGDNGFNGAVFNKKAGPMSNVLLRRAAAAAIDHKAVQTAAFADPKYFDLDGALSAEGNRLRTEVGLENFNTHDVDKAKRLMREAGYKNEPIRILTSREYEDHYNSAVVVEDNLKKAGFNASLLVTDWPTLLSTRSDEKAYEIFTTGWAVTNLPIQQVFFVSSWPGWTDDPELTEYLNGITFAKDDQAQFEAAKNLQKRFFEYQPIIKYGNKKTIIGAAANVEGLRFQRGAGVVLWEVHVGSK